MDIFAKAVKTNLTFPTSRGQRLPQEIYQLPLTGNNGYNLDTISQELLERMSKSQSKSLVTVSKASAEDNLRLEILKFIIADKQYELEENKQKSFRKQEREKLQKLIAQKQDEKMGEKSLEELMKELAALEE